MVNSMTAFARSELSTDQGNLAWEMRSVNHRYLEVTLRLPEAFRELEGPLRERLRNDMALEICVARGGPVGRRPGATRGGPGDRRPADRSACSR